MRKYDCIFLDRDGTINHDPGYIKNLNNFRFYDFLFPALKKISEVCNKFCIVSNQSGVARGIIEKKNIFKINEYIFEQFRLNKIQLVDIYVNFDHPENPTENRKPGSGMFLKAEKNHSISLSKCLIIGDSICDIQAGKSLGMDTMLVLTGNGKKTKSNLIDSNIPTFIVDDLKAGANKICR